MLTAKEIFIDNGCNHFHIHREGYWDEYIRLGGDNKKNERAWRLEYIKYWLEKIPTDTINAFDRLGQVCAVEILDDLLEYDNFSDDYVKFWYSFMLLDIAKGIYNPLKKVKVKRTAKDILKGLLNKELDISPINKKEITLDIIAALEASSAEGYIKNYSKRLLS